MRKISENEMRRVNGGAAHIITATCEGFDRNGHQWHSVIIEGKGDDYTAAAIRFNKKLDEHKANIYYSQFTHSAKRVPL